MNINCDEAAGFADLTMLEGCWEAHARRHICFLCWNTGQSPVIKIANNGTCCLVRTRTHRMLVTCAHVWKAFEKFCRAKKRAKLWISLVADNRLSSPSYPLLLSNPNFIAIDDGLDLTTVTFDEIDSLDARRFCYLGSSGRPVVKKGDIVHIVGFPGEHVRAGKPDRKLFYSYSRRGVHDVGYTQFVLHAEAGTLRHKNVRGEAIPPFRAPGESGAPVFKVRNDLELDLVGIVSFLSSSDLRGGMDTQYEMSDGDVYITYTRFIQDDGSIVPP